jgi:hypothetical protein
MKDDHSLFREFKERREYKLEIVDGELEVVYENSTYQGGEPLQTIKCSCGERFVKEDLAIEHIRSVRGESDRESGIDNTEVPPGKMPTEEQVDDIRRRLLDGESGDEIAMDYPVTYSTVIEWAKGGVKKVRSLDTEIPRLESVGTTNNAEWEEASSTSERG